MTVGAVLVCLVTLAAWQGTQVLHQLAMHFDMWGQKYFAVIMRLVGLKPGCGVVVKTEDLTP